MNINILNIENQDFINRNLNSNISELLLRGTADSLAETKELIEQIEAKKRCKKKLPTWFNSVEIYYPNKLNIEQTSSEATAKYKSQLISGNSIIDLTGGFGVDCYYFSKQFKEVTHCELNTKLSQIVAHNFKQLETNNIKCLNINGIEVLNELNQTFDYIYIDPSRRNDVKGKVFQLKDCLPDVPQHLDLFFKHSKRLMIKTSPLLDLTIGIYELKGVKTIHSIAVNNEVKELLWILESGYSGKTSIKTVNLLNDGQQQFDFNLDEEPLASSKYNQPLSYLYEPNSAVLKAGAFNSISEKLNVFKLHKHSHLYTSEALIDFPGRRFKIDCIINYNKKQFKRELKITKANVTTRNFPESVQSIRKKLSIKDGGDNYLFFTTDLDDNKIIISCTKEK